MARIRNPSHLLDLVDSESDDDLGGIAAKAKRPAPPNTRIMAPVKRGRPPAKAAATAAASKVTKPAPKKETAAQRRAAERRAAAAAAAVESADEDDADDADDTTDRPALAARASTNEPATAPKGKPRQARKAAPDDDEMENTALAPADSDTSPAAKKRGRRKGAAAKPESTAAGRKKASASRAKKAKAAADEEATEPEEDDAEADDSQPEPDTTDAALADTMDVDADDTAAPGDDTDMHTDAASAVAAAGRGRPAPQPAAPDDAAMRRRLGEAAKKYDTLEARFRDLRDFGVKESEQNFERLKKQSEERTKASDDLVASLKAELARFRDLAQEGARHKREWDASEARNSALQARVDELAAALGEAKAEARTLTTKLSAARTEAAPAHALSLAMVPGSAMKKGLAAKGGAGTAAAAAAAATSAQQQQLAQLKENLYGDLTGLLVWSARRDGTREMYDCIQTGRSGSLHFKLCIDEGEGDKKTDDDAQFVYMPQLDASRDAALISRLPDYLVEEISFPRAQAAKFYSRVVQSLAAAADK